MLHLAMSPAAPLAPRLVALLVLVPLGLLVGTVGLLGLAERLPRNRFAGVRTAATLRTEEDFRLANRVAGPVLLAAGVVGVLTGTVAALAMTPAATFTVGGLGLLGVLALAVTGGVLGDRAAMALRPPRHPEQPPSGCSGCVCAGGGCLSRKLSGDGGGPRVG